MKISVTKRSLLTSVAALLLCFVMLLGATFAWFTDNVTSTRNVIQAGNLDVELYYQNSETANWTLVDANTNVFKDTLWEPGHTEVVKFKVANEGTLALKYLLNVKVFSEIESENIDGAPFKLSDYIMYGIVDGELNVDREAAINAVAGVATKLNIDYATDTENALYLASGEDDVVTMVVYMPETVGNEANYGKGKVVPEIELGVNLFATQKDYEADSFGPDYDISAELPKITVHSAAELQEALNTAETGTTVISLADDITENFTITQKADRDFIIEGNGNEISGSVLLDGRSASIETAGAVIRNVVFTDANFAADACINLGDGANTSTRYVYNLTVENCVFDAPGKVGIKSYTGGDANLRIVGCTATENAHSLAQLKGVDGVTVENCTVKSVRGINFNNSLDVKIINTVIDVQKYAVRFGESDNTGVEEYAITNCTLNSQNVDGDATIVLRKGATNAKLTLKNTVVNGTLPMAGHENAQIIVE